MSEKQDSFNRLSAKSISRSFHSDNEGNYNQVPVGTCEEVSRNHVQEYKKITRERPDVLLVDGVTSIADIDVTMDDGFQNKSTKSMTNNNRSIYSTSSLNNHLSQRSKLSGTTGRSESVENVKICSLPTCNEGNCVWHTSVLKFPHRVIWNAEVKTIELKKDNQSFDFGFQIKKKILKEAKENFMLVKKVEENSTAAVNGLAVGDLILSVNGKALQSIGLTPNVEKEFMKKKVRLQIHQPIGILERHEEQPEIHIDPSIPLSSPLTPSTSPSTSNFMAALTPAKEHIPLEKFRSIDQEIEQRDKLLQTRLFICGNSSNELVASLLGKYSSSVHIDSKAYRYCLSMTRDPNNQVMFSQWQSVLRLSAEQDLDTINVELISIQDASFFHNCTSWMLTPNSLFVLTFNSKKLTNANDAEMCRLSELADTIRAAVGPQAMLQMMGIVNENDGISHEEVQTLFYTYLGESLPEPNLVSISSSDPEARLKLFNRLLQLCLEQDVSQELLYGVEFLVSQQSLTVSSKELQTVVSCYHDKQDLISNETFVEVEEQLRNTGNLLLSSSSNRHCVASGTKEYVLPGILFDCLCRLCQTTESDRCCVKVQEIYQQLSQLGYINREDLQELLKVSEAETLQLERCLEDFCISFPLGVTTESDSGFLESSVVLLPYFLQDAPSTVDPEIYARHSTISLLEKAPCSTFYLLISELSNEVSCRKVEFECQRAACLELEPHTFVFQFSRTCRDIDIYIKRQANVFPGKLPITDRCKEILLKLVGMDARVETRLAARSGGATLSSGDRPTPSYMAVGGEGEVLSHTHGACHREIAFMGSQVAKESTESKIVTNSKPTVHVDTFENSPEPNLHIPSPPKEFLAPKNCDFQVSEMSNQTIVTQDIEKEIEENCTLEDLPSGSDNLSTNSNEKLSKKAHESPVAAPALPENLLFQESKPIVDSERLQLADFDIEAEQTRLLDQSVKSLNHIYAVLYEIYSFLSPDNRFETFLGVYLGTSFNEMERYKSFFYTSNGQLPAKVVIEKYLQENNLNLRDFIKALLQMSSTFPKIAELTHRLWEESWRWNSFK